MATTPAPLPDLDIPEGRRHVWCRACRRPLHDPESRITGYGPDCRAKLHPRPAPRTAEHDVDQDAIPGT